MITTQQTIKPLKNAVASLATAKEIGRMVESLKLTGLFTVEHTDETLRAHHTKSGQEVLVGLAKGHGQPWILRTHPKLWASPI